MDLPDPDATCGDQRRRGRGGELVECTFPSDEEELDDALVATLHRVVEEQQTLREIVMVAMRCHYDAVRSKFVDFAHRQPSFMGDPNVAMPGLPRNAGWRSGMAAQASLAKGVAIPTTHPPTPLSDAP